MRSGSLVVALLVLMPPATNAVAQDGGHLRLLKGAVTPCVDGADGWYAARVVGMDSHGRYDLRVTATIHGPRRKRIVLKSRLSSPEWRRMNGAHDGERVVVRMPYYVAWREGEFGGCRSFFWQGTYPSDRHAFPIVAPDAARMAKLPPAYAHYDGFGVRLAYLRAYFAGKKDPSGDRLAADLNSGSIPIELAAADVIGSSVATRSEAWDTLGPPLTKLAAHLPPMMDPGHWHELVVDLGMALRRSVATHGGRGAAPLPWWKPAERALLTSLAWFPRDNYSVLAWALRPLGFRLDPERPDLKKVNAVRRKFGMKPLPAGTHLVFPTYTDRTRRHLDDRATSRAVHRP